jgi:glycosyltransferase involved in cell wall biosynthesis
VNLRGSYPQYLLKRGVFLLFDLALLLPLAALALLSRAFRRPVAVGLGPTPVINSVHHKKALMAAGWTAETFVDSVWHMTSDFDFRADRVLPGKLGVLRPYLLFVRALFRYRSLYTYFSGGSLRTTTVLCHLEPALLKLAGIRTVLLAFGADVNVLTRTANLLFVDGMARDYPTHRFLRRHIVRSIDVWTRWADHIVAGCDWVDYLYYWDKLQISHFAIDTDDWRPMAATPPSLGSPLRVLHAPNHRRLKGTDAILRAVEELRAEGVAIELAMVEGQPNAAVRAAICDADLVIDQLIVGWYAMLSIEAMALGKPVICYLRDDLLRLYRSTGLLTEDELPLVNADVTSVKSVLRKLATDRSPLADLGRKGREYVVRRHSLKAIGADFDSINKAIGLQKT